MLFESTKKDKKIEIRVTEEQKDCIRVLGYKKGFTKYSDYILYLIKQDFESYEEDL